MRHLDDCVFFYDVPQAWTGIELFRKRFVPGGGSGGLFSVNAIRLARSAMF
jgi:hypothetical protein